MMNIKHYPITNTINAEAAYSRVDGVPIKYVCTTELPNESVGDIFYRETPHPEFGIRYFALFWKRLNNDEVIMISNADFIENVSFGMVQNDDNELEYSMTRHDYKSFNNGNMIDGGRDYIRSSGNAKVFVVRNGEMINHESNT